MHATGDLFALTTLHWHSSEPLVFPSQLHDQDSAKLNSKPHCLLPTYGNLFSFSFNFFLFNKKKKQDPKSKSSCWVDFNRHGEPIRAEQLTYDSAELRDYDVSAVKVNCKCASRLLQLCQWIRIYQEKRIEEKRQAICYIYHVMEVSLG